MCANPHPCVCITAFGNPVVPDVYDKIAISSRFVSSTVSSELAVCIASSIEIQSCCLEPTINLVS